jgi:AraC-like DNA-binding protein
MTSKPMISVSAATGLLEAIAAAGGDAERVLRPLGLKRGGLDDPDRYIESAVFSSMLELAAVETRDPCFGLHFGEHFDPRDLGTLGYVVLNSPSISEALRNIERYLHMHNEAAQAALSTEGERARLRFWLAGVGPQPAIQHGDYGMALALKALRTLAGQEWYPAEVRLAHRAPGNASEHRRIFGRGVAFDCHANEFVFDTLALKQPAGAADDRLYRILKQHAERLLGDMPQSSAPLSAVTRATVEAMLEGNPHLSAVARKMSLGPRTLERRLKIHGIVFKELLDDTRRRFALSYLKTRQRSLTEIAFLLGYSEASAFNRAFRRWTGWTPAEYRRQHRH